MTTSGGSLSLRPFSTQALGASEYAGNTTPGLSGKKLGNTQIFLDDGEVRRVTAIQVGPCIVLRKRTPTANGYAALELGFGTRSDKHINKPLKGRIDKAKTKAPRVIREFRLSAEMLDHFEVGQEISAKDIFIEGQFVDVTGTSKGRGFSGVIKRHNFAGAGTVGHGTHEYKRHGGSIGQNMTPGRVFPGMKMPGQYGNKRVSVLNLKIAKILEEESIVLVEGSVPGSKNAIVTLKGAFKKPSVALPEKPLPPAAEANDEAPAAEATA